MEPVTLEDSIEGNEEKNKKHPKHISRKGYDQQAINAIRFIENRSGALSWIHNYTSRFYSFIHRLVVFIAGACAAICGGNLFSILFIGQLNVLVMVVIAVLMVMGAITMGVGYLGLDGKAATHINLAKLYSRLHISCIEMLNRKPENRMKAKKFILAKIKEDYLNHQEAYDIPNFVIRRYYNTFKIHAVPYDIIMKDYIWTDDDDDNQITNLHAQISQTELVPTHPNQPKQTLKQTLKQKCKWICWPCKNKSTTKPPKTVDTEIVNRKYESIMTRIEAIAERDLVSVDEIKKIIDEHPLRGSVVNSKPSQKYKRKPNKDNLSVYELGRFNSIVIQ